MSRSSTRSIALALCAAFLVFVGSAPAQSAKLDELKAQYQAEVVTAERELKEKYIQALERIQQNLQSQAKLEAALAVKREREKIEAELAASGGSTDPGGTPSVPSGAKEFVFKSDSATPVGNVELVAKWDTLTGWRDPGSGAEWAVSSLPAGVYSVKVEYSSPADGASVRISQGLASFDFAFSSTGSWDTYSSTEVGQVNVSNPSSPLRILVVDDGGAPFGLINLRSVTLSRIGS